MRLFSNRSQRMSKCGKNISDTLGCTSCATFLFLPHFDVICHLLLNRRTATWNLFVKYTIAATTFGLNVLEKKEIEKQLVFSIFTVTAVVLDWFVSDWFYLDSFLQWITWFERATRGICIFFFFWPFNLKECLASNSPNSITHKSNVEVMRVKEMITYLRSSWLSNKFSLLAP